MGKLFIVGFAIAAAAAAYIYWFRRSPGDVRDDLMSAASSARDYASSMASKAGDMRDDAVSTAGDQINRARDAVSA